MKKRMLALAALMLGITTVTAQPINYRIEANIDSLPAGKMFLVNREKFSKFSDAVDSVVVADGRFSFSGASDNPWIGSLLFRAEDADKPQMLIGILFIEDGTVKLSGNLRGIEESGTPANDVNRIVSRRIEQLRKENIELSKDASREEIIKNNEVFVGELKKIMKDAIAKNSSNLAGPYFLQQVSSVLSDEEIMDIITGLSPDMQQSSLAVRVKEKVDGRMRRGSGVHFTDFKLPAPDSTEIALSEIVAKNKYVLVDFWASWCGPCISEMPHLKAAYEKYHDKGFEIFGVSYDDSKDKWLGAIEKYGMSWVHVSALKGWGCPTVAMFGITGIPSSFLVGSDGIVVGGGYRGKALEAKLAELFGDENE